MTGKTLETSRTSPSYQFGASDKRSPGGFPTLQASLLPKSLKYKGFSLWRDGERLGKGCKWGAIFQSANLGGRPLTPDPVGQPFWVLSFLPYSQTLGPIGLRC